MGLERREVHFKGQVQGVGFRYTAKRLASGFDVTGWVKNLPNGQVLLVAEGVSKEIDALVQAIQADMRDNIDEVHSVSGACQGTLDSFDITY